VSLFDSFGKDTQAHRTGNKSETVEQKKIHVSNRLSSLAAALLQRLLDRHPMTGGTLGNKIRQVENLSSHIQALGSETPG